MRPLVDTAFLAPQRSAAPPQPVQLVELPQHSPRNRPLDRLALRVALALVLWSTRADTDHATLARQQRDRLARDRREQDWRLAAHRLPAL